MDDDDMEERLQALGEMANDSAVKLANTIKRVAEAAVFLEVRLGKETERSIRADMLLVDRVAALEAKLKELTE